MNNMVTQPCRFCLDASCDPEGELTTENDYSSLPVGSVAEGYRMSIDVGCGKPLKICITHWDSHMQQNELVGSYNELIGFYKPKFCPECGRKLVEQQHDGKHTDYVHYDYDTIEETEA